MNDDRKQAMTEISELFDSQTLAVLSTQKNEQPYASLVAFSASADLEYFYFLTPNTTRKYDNLISNTKVAVLVNNSHNSAEDIYNAISVTGTGNAEVIEKEAEKEALDHYLAKHPHLAEFSRAPTTAFIRIKMKRYFLVSRFQNVTELRIGS